MKRFGYFLLLALLTVALFGCGKQEATYTVSRNGREFVVDRDQKTITDGDNIYHYEYTGDASAFKVTVTYPDGSSYWYDQSGNMGQGGWSNDYAEGAYISGDILVDIVQENAPKKTNPGKMLGAMLLIALGLVDAVCPKVAWYIGYGWRYKNAEPSDAAFVFGRIGGIAVIVAGVILLLC